MKWKLAIRVCAVSLPFVMGCETPRSKVVLRNDYPPAPANALVVIDAFWQAVRFTTPVPPGASSEPENTVPASPNTAYVLLAHGTDIALDGGSRSTSFIVLVSRLGFAVNLDDTLHIPVSDITFAGNCTAGSFLPQDQADFVTQRVFPSEFSGLHYDARTCTSLPTP